MSKGHSPRRYNVARYDRNRARIRWRKRRTVVDEIEALIDEAGIGGKRKQQRERTER